MTLKTLLLVFAGGGIGSIIRFLLSSFIAPYSSKFPYSTLIVNIVSCVLLGMLIGWSSKHFLSDDMKLFLMVGICGGFSTFSTFSAESYQLFNTGAIINAFIYMGASFIICLIAIYLGMRVVN